MLLIFITFIMKFSFSNALQNRLTCNNKVLKPTLTSNFASKISYESGLLDSENFDAELVEFGFEECKMMAASRGKNHHGRFGKSLEDSPALVLNANFVPVSYLPLSLWNWQDSLRAVLNEKAVALHHYDLAIRSVSVSIMIPSVIVLKRFQKLPDKVPSMTRRNGMTYMTFAAHFIYITYH